MSFYFGKECDEKVSEVAFPDDMEMTNMLYKIFERNASTLHVSFFLHDNVEVKVHAVGLNFKDVLNVILPDEAAYEGFDVPPLPGADFAGVVTAIPSSKIDTETTCGFSVGDKVYGLSFDMLRSRARVSTGSIARMPSNLSFEEASALPMVFMTV